MQPTPGMTQAAEQSAQNPNTQQATPPPAEHPHDFATMLHDSSQKAKKGAKGIARDVFVNILVGGVLAGIGLLVWYFIGIVGVHYSEAEQPWRDMTSSYRAVDSEIAFNIIASDPSPFGATSPEKVKDTHASLSAKLSAYKKANDALLETKAFTKGDLAANGQDLKQKSQAYITYITQRLASYELVMSAIATCPSSITTTEITAMKTCHATLSKIDPAAIQDPEFLAAFTGYQTYIDDAIGVTERWAAAPTAQKFAISRELNTLYTKRSASLSAIREKQNKAYDAVKLNTLIQSIERELNQKIKTEGK